MRRLVPFVAGIAVVASALLPATVRADNQDVIDYREHIMKSMGEQAAAIGMIIAKKAPADNFVLHVQTLAVIATEAEKAFEPKIPGGEAKPDVWANWADFSKRMKEIVANTADLAKTAQAGGVDAVAAKMQSAMTCKSCHDTYRQQKK